MSDHGWNWADGGPTITRQKAQVVAIGGIFKDVDGTLYLEAGWQFIVPIGATIPVQSEAPDGTVLTFGYTPEELLEFYTRRKEFV